MSPVLQSIQDRGISEAAAKLIMVSWRDGTKIQYSTYITKWQTFCNQRQISQIQPSVVSVLDFLTLLYQQGLTYSAINTARSTLSSHITLQNGTCVGKHPLVSRLMKGVFQEKPPRPKYTEIWDVSIVLPYLQSLSPVDKLPLKELTLKLLELLLLVSGQRGQTFHLLSIDYVVSVNNCYTFQIVDHLKQSRPGVKNPLMELRPFKDETLCVVTTLKEYLTRTKFTRRTKWRSTKRLEWCTKFHAAYAKRYISVKQGDSWEPGSQNTERKQKRSLTEISQEPPAELLPMNTINQS